MTSGVSHSASYDDFSIITELISIDMYYKVLNMPDTISIVCLHGLHLVLRQTCMNFQFVEDTSNFGTEYCIE